MTPHEPWEHFVPSLKRPTATAISELWLTKKSSIEVKVQSVLEEAVHTCSNADHRSQALISFPHDDGSQDLAPEQAVLDVNSEVVEALVAQHGHLIMQGAAAYRELGWRHNSTGSEQVTQHSPRMS